MRYLSLFSGIESASVAWKEFGWKCVGISEIEPYPCEVLKHHYPDVINFGDISKITETQIQSLGQIDLIVFGSPCTDLSLSGKRRGFIDENGNTTRSGLFYNAINIINWARKYNRLRFSLWENVPGAFCSNKGRDFATVVEQMAGLEDVQVPIEGWGSEGVILGSDSLTEWCVLDSQWFGLAQRRKRVFALSDFGDWQNRPPILLEPEELRLNFNPSKKKECSSPIELREDTEGLFEIRDNFCNREWPARVTQCLDTWFASAGGMENQHIFNGASLFVPHNDKIRKLTPIEFERLQGFPDNYTKVPYKKDSDEMRYKALGNSMSVPVMKWIGKQIDSVVNDTLIYDIEKIKSLDDIFEENTK